MQKSLKFLKLRKLLEQYKIKNNNKPNIQTQGQIIQILKSITFFNNQVNTYGIEVLKYYINLIETYILRAGMQIIDTNEEYVVVKGNVNGIKSNRELVKVYKTGMLIDPSLQLSKPEQMKLTFISKTDQDAQLIKIVKNNQKYILQKYPQNLKKFQKQRKSKQRQMQKIIRLDKNLQINKEKLLNYQFFNKISDFDLNQLIIQSKLLLMKKGQTIYQFGDPVNHISFLLSGQVQINNSITQITKKIADPLKLLLHKYMIHKKENTPKIVSYIQAGQWIGLQQYLWQQKSFMSKTQIISHDAQVFQISIQTFRKKFNQLTDLYRINKVKGLIETKKSLLEKTIQTKKQQEIQMIRSNQQDETLKKIQARLQNNQKTKNNFCKQRKQYKNLTKQIRNLSDFKIPIPKSCYSYDRITHKIKVFQQKYSSLPKVSERFTLFPQEYQKANIPLQLKNQLKMIKKSTKPIKRAETFRILCNQKILQAAIYTSLTPKQNNPEQTKRKITKLKSKSSVKMFQKIDWRKQILQTERSAQNITKIRFNNSICNNFRAPKNKGQKLFQHLVKNFENS